MALAACNAAPGAAPAPAAETDAVVAAAASATGTGTTCPRVGASVGCGKRSVELRVASTATVDEPVLEALTVASLDNDTLADRVVVMLPFQVSEAVPFDTPTVSDAGDAETVTVAVTDDVAASAVKVRVSATFFDHETESDDAVAISFGESDTDTSEGVTVGPVGVKDTDSRLTEAEIDPGLAVEEVDMSCVLVRDG